jgi:hypothetical protein
MNTDFTNLRAPRGTSILAATLIAALVFWLFVAHTIQPAQARTPEAAEQYTVYGPKEFRREKGKAITMTDTFAVDWPASACLMTVENGTTATQDHDDDPGSCDHVSSATIDLNGRRVFDQSDLNQQVEYVERPVEVLPNNDLRGNEFTKVPFWDEWLCPTIASRWIAPVGVRGLFFRCRQFLHPSRKRHPSSLRLCASLSSRNSRHD